MNFGFIGIGIMGRPMALNVMKAGFPMTVYNRTQKKCEPLVAAGARLAQSPADVARHSDVIVTIVSDTPDVEAVLFGPQGVVEGLNAPGKIVIDMSTISPLATEDFARRLAEKGCEMLDAPVSGGEKGAIEGTLAIMVGGKEEVFKKCLPAFQAMGKTIVYLGKHGNGQRTKAVNQIVAALHLEAMAEGIRLARHSGLDPQTMLDVVSKGAAGSWMLSNLAPRILRNDFAPGFMISLQQKDLRVAMELMRQVGGHYPGTELTYRLFSEAVKKGLGDEGTQAIIKLYD